MNDFRRFLAANHGVFTRAQARAFGLTDRQIDWRHKIGEFNRVSPRVYRIATSPSTWESRARAAALGARGLVSHTSALAVWRVDGHSRWGRPHLVIDRSRRPRSVQSAIVHRLSPDLAAGHLVDGMPVVNVTAAVVQSASILSDSGVEAMIDSVVRQRLTSIKDLQVELERLGTRGRRGLGRLAQAFATGRSPNDPVPDSRFNRLVGELLVRAGLPKPNYEWDGSLQQRSVCRASRPGLSLSPRRHRMCQRTLAQKPPRLHRRPTAKEPASTGRIPSADLHLGRLHQPPRHHRQYNEGCFGATGRRGWGPQATPSVARCPNLGWRRRRRSRSRQRSSRCYR